MNVHYRKRRRRRKTNVIITASGQDLQYIVRKQTFLPVEQPPLMNDISQW